MGQYFTPSAVVDLMVGLNNPGEKGELTRVLDPACGSGRMGLAAGVQAIKNSAATWVTMNDIDPICTKMTAINMCLNGVIGEAICMNGLDITGDTFRFGYKVEPAIAQWPSDMVEYYRMVIMAKTGQDIKKQYVLKPITYEQTYLKGVNEQLLKEYEKHKEIANQEQRETAIQELKEEVARRMAGTLFDGDTSQVENVVLPEKHPKQQKKRNPKPSTDEQGKLF